MNLSTLYDKLEKLVNRLPAGLQVPILREISPIKTLFLQQRPPRILLLGERGASRSALVNALFGAEIAVAGEDLLQDGAWQTFASDFGKLQLLDARRPVAASLVKRALEGTPADIALWVQAGGVSASDAEDVQRAREVLAEKVPVFGVVMEAEPTAAHGLHERLEEPGWNVIGTHVLSLGPDEVHKFTVALAGQLPGETKLEFARLSGVIELQRELAGVLIKSASAVCGVVGAQPIPLADFPILTMLQSAMVAGIMDIAGRKWSAKLAAEWIAALGANVGVALVLREGARAVLKLVPFWGDVVSGGIAAAGTYAVGKAASAYFIEGMTLADAQRLFRERKKPEQLGP